MNCFKVQVRCIFDEFEVIVDFAVPKSTSYSLHLLQDGQVDLVVQVLDSNQLVFKLVSEVW